VRGPPQLEEDPGVLRVLLERLEEELGGTLELLRPL
jgi:hypothetical protein